MFSHKGVILSDATITHDALEHGTYPPDIRHVTYHLSPWTPEMEILPSPPPATNIW